MVFARPVLPHSHRAAPGARSVRSPCADSAVDLRAHSNVPHGAYPTPSACHTPHLPGLQAHNKENDLAQLNAQMSRHTLGFSKPTPTAAHSVFAPPPATFAMQSPIRKPQEKRATLADVPGLRRWCVFLDVTDLAMTDPD